MTDDIKELYSSIVTYEKEKKILLEKIAHLEQIAQASKDVISAFSKPEDYHIWDEALDKLEALLAKK